MRVRAYAAEDAEPVRALFVRVNRELAPPSLFEAFEAYIARALKEEIGRIPEYYAPGRGRGFWVAEDAETGALLGTFGLEPAGDNAAELRRMYVAPEARRHGLARRMLAEAERLCVTAGLHRLMLSTSELQEAALALYRGASYRLMHEEVAEASTSKTVGSGLRRFHFEKILAPATAPIGDEPTGRDPDLLEAVDEAACRGSADDITWYFDLVSPFSYLALRAVEALAARRAVTFRPVLLGVLLSHWKITGPAEIGPKRLFTYRQVQFTAERAGLAFRFPPRHPFRSLDAMRLLVALGAAPKATRTAFDFVWAEGRDPSLPDELDALGARLGVADVGALVAESGARERLRDLTEAALNAGVFGVPTLAVGGELFWGADAMPLAEAYLADPGLLSHGEIGRSTTLSWGIEPRPRPP